MAAETGTMFFKLTDLHSLYETLLKEPGTDIMVHKTGLKNKIVWHFNGQIQEQSDGKYTILALQEGMRNLMKEALAERNYQAEALALSKAARNIRNDAFKEPLFDFAGEFEADCQSASVPANLKCLISMLLNGPSIKNQVAEESQTYLTMAQLVVFNMKKKCSSPKTA